MDTIVPTRYPDEREHMFYFRENVMAYSVCRQLVTMHFQIPDLAVVAQATMRTYESGEWVLTIFPVQSAYPIVVEGDAGTTACDAMQRVFAAFGYVDLFPVVAD